MAASSRVHSMTAFARTEQAASFGTLQVEIRSVNQRYLEPHFRLHESLRDLEPILREALRTRLARGKVECSVRFESADTALAPAVNSVRLAAIADALRAIQQQVPSAVPPTTLALLNQPGVMETQHLDQDAIKAAAKMLFDQALNELIDARAREGDKLAEMITTRLTAVSEQVATVRSLLPQILERQRAQLLERLEVAKTELDPQRLEAELVLVAQKADVDEELDRLTAHIEEVSHQLAQKGPKGRRLDFLMQELNREANTLSSKSVVAETTRCAVELKVLIEQMREQIQNIE
ncbi:MULTISPECIES: YicC/YloC family endoribonuclease [unclassified Halomonas]|uniref:YicC/YloC family endoribonuclease n=1 Tax=unclassified Halomonas TaxID=2609666 RepID=UPI0007DA3808|nr:MULTISPECIES: YicC/YloC family endoribonuclease [unclassified Halomonas]MBT2787600.1 YicC family protein [Halomonas sp. ISL-106]MBT2799017.1 YicC family protein [Halomonas sp. ISL-104]OAL61548.1 YicC family protein [Halomonas sp. ALS9]